MRLLYAIEGDPGLDALRDLAGSDGGEYEEYIESDTSEGCPEWDRLLHEARRGDTVYVTLQAIVNAEGDSIAHVLDGMPKRGVVLKVFDVDRDDLYTTRVLGPS